MVTQASRWEAIPVKRCRFVESLGCVYTHMRYILEHQPSSLRHQCKQTVTVLTGALLPNPQGHTHTQKSKQPHSQWQADTHWGKNTVYRAYVCVSLWGVGLCSNMSLSLVRDSWVGVGILVSASVLWLHIGGFLQWTIGLFPCTLGSGNRSSGAFELMCQLKVQSTQLCWSTWVLCLQVTLLGIPLFWCGTTARSGGVWMRGRACPMCYWTSVTDCIQWCLSIKVSVRKPQVADQSVIL